MDNREEKIDLLEKVMKEAYLNQPPVTLTADWQEKVFEKIKNKPEQTTLPSPSPEPGPSLEEGIYRESNDSSAFLFLLAGLNVFLILAIFMVNNLLQSVLMRLFLELPSLSFLLRLLEVRK